MSTATAVPAPITPPRPRATIPWSAPSTAGWTETQPDGAAFTYDSSGVLRTIRNQAGVRWTLTWDSGFNTVQHIDGPLGRRTSFAYNASNLLRRIQDPGGRITTVTVNANTDLTQIISPELCVTTLLYDNAHHLVAWVNPLGDRTSFSYQINGIIKAVRQPLGQTTSYTVAQVPPNQATVITNPRGGRSTIVYAGGVPSSSTDVFGNQTTYKFDSFSSRLTRVIDGRGIRTSYVYQSLTSGVYSVAQVQKPGYVSSFMSGGTGQYAFAYDGNNRVKAVIDELGNRSSLVWDSQGNRVGVIDPFGKRTSFAYDTLGRLAAVRNALGLRATQTYDSQGRRLADIDPLGNRTTYAYDVNSQPLRVTDPLGHITTTLHDNMNRLLVSVDALGNRTSLTYDANGRLSSVKDPLGHVTTRLYDANSRLVGHGRPPGPIAPAMPMTRRAIGSG